MPVEIRELVIRATITDEIKSDKQTSASRSGDNSSSEQLVKLCVEKVLAILKEKNER